MKTVFVVGVTSSTEHQRLIEEESQIYHDIIQVNFIDSYRNLTLKTLSIFHWTGKYCPRASWLLKSDEDVFVNPYALKDFLSSHRQAGFACFIYHFSWVCRWGENCPQKWAVTQKEYPHTVYPPYCKGAAYIVSSSMVRKVFAAANKTHPFVIEDAYFTGIVALPFLPEYVDLKGRFYFFVSSLSKVLWDGTVLLNIFEWEVRNASSYSLWDKIVKYNLATRLPHGNITLRIPDP